MPETKKKKKVWKIVLISIGSFFATILLTVGVCAIVALCYKNQLNTDPSYVKPEDGNQLAFTYNQSIYDKDGNRLILRGCNVGGLLNSEGWMVPFRDDEGRATSLAEDQAREALNSNPNLTEEQKEEVVNTYRHNWFSDDDFKRVKDDFHFNTLRLPVYWGEMMEYVGDEFVLKDEDIAFAYLDYFVSKCQENNLYCVFDLHAAPVTQSGFNHSGHVTTKRSELLWYSEKGIDATVRLWEFIVRHYQTKSELGKSIVMYDLLNEPSSSNEEDLSKKQTRYTPKEAYPVFDRIYKAIRNLGDKHIISINCIWTYWQFPDPRTYNWTNVVYQIHIYNNLINKINFSQMMYGFEFTRFFHNYKVPYYVGEFQGYGNEGNWRYLISFFEGKGYGWTMWSYKKSNAGHWDDAWGLYNNNLNEKPKVSLRSAIYTELIEAFTQINTTNCQLSCTGQFIQNILK